MLRPSVHATPPPGNPLKGIRPQTNVHRSYLALPVTCLARNGKRIYFERAREIAGKVVLKLLGAAWGLFEGLLGAALKRSWAVFLAAGVVWRPSWVL